MHSRVRLNMWYAKKHISSAKPLQDTAPAPLSPLMTRPGGEAREPWHQLVRSLLNYSLRVLSMYPFSALLCSRSRFAWRAVAHLSFAVFHLCYQLLAVNILSLSLSVAAAYA